MKSDARVAVLRSVQQPRQTLPMIAAAGSSLPRGRDFVARSRFRDKPIGLAEVGRRLGVSYLVQGGVRRIGEHVRITVTLMEAETGTHMWAGRYDRKLDDIFAIQDEVAQIIVSTLFGTIEHTKVEQAFRKPTESMVAYDFLLRGLAHFRGYAAEDNRRACEMFEKAVALDPRYALAHAYLALVRVALDGYASASADVLNAAFGIAAC